MSKTNNTDFVLFSVSYIHPISSKIIDCGEMRGYYAKKFIKDWENKGVATVVENKSKNQDITDIHDLLLDLCEED